MKITIKEEITVDVIKDMIDDEPISDRETFAAGEVLDVDSFDEQDQAWGFQFCDGSVFYLPVESFRLTIE